MLFQGLDEVIDVVTPSKNLVYYSSDEEDDCVYEFEDAKRANRPLWFIPVSPDSEVVDENAPTGFNSMCFCDF